MRTNLILQLDDRVVLLPLVSGDMVQLTVSSLFTIAWSRRIETHLVQLVERLSDDLDGLSDVFLADDQWRGESDTTSSEGLSSRRGRLDSHVDVRGLGEQPESQLHPSLR